MPLPGCFYPGGRLPGGPWNGSFPAANCPLQQPPCEHPDRVCPLPEGMLQPSILASFSGADVFITGGTGFVGSVIIEQLLRLVPDVGTIFVLVRPKAGAAPEDRLEALLAKPLFDALRPGATYESAFAGVCDFKTKRGPIRPDLRAKLRVVAGDVCQPDCGLGAADLEAVRTKSRFVIHCAASISFFDHVHTLLTQNYRATANVVTLAMRCAALAGYVHVSTAYVNINRPRGSHVEEKIYPLALPDGTPVRHADTAAELLGLPPKEATATANKLVAKLGYPNAYTLSKHLAEDLVAELHAAGRITACIVRPSIVGANAYGPSSGYFGNTAGPTSLTLAFASGMARFTCLNPDHVWDIIPCDIVAACVLGTAAALAAGAAPADEPLITHCASSVSNGERYGTLFNGVIFPYWAANPPKKRFTSGPYKPVDHWTAFLPATMFAFKWLNAWNTMKFKAIATLLKAHGRPDLAKQVWQGWKVYKLYNTPALDFDIFYCVSRAAAIEAALPEAERAAGAFQMVWAKGRDDWASYLTRHADVVRAKFFARYEKKPAGDAPPPPLPVAPAAPLGLSSALPPPPGCACADGLVMIPPCAVVSSAPEAAKGGVVIEEEGAAVAA